MTSPPMTTYASGRCISAPSPVESAIGKNPKLSTRAVIKIGRSRTRAVSRLATLRSVPIRRARSAAVTQTSPFSTDTPNSAMNPTPAEMLNDNPRTAKAKTPPEAAIGTAKKMSAAIRVDPNVVCNSRKMMSITIGVIKVSRWVAYWRF